MIPNLRILATLISLGLPMALQAETFGAAVMAPGPLAELAPGTRLVYTHSRQLPEAAPEAPSPAGGYRRLAAQPLHKVTVESLGSGLVALQQDGRTLAEFPSTAPHPVLLMFLENVMRSVSQETGGSPHYIRNRMRQTLGAAEVQDGSLRLAPFANDAEKTRLGAFAGLEIEVRWQERTPAFLTSLSARLPAMPERYSETFTLDLGE